MTDFKDMLKKQQYDEIWQEYCGFLELNIEQYMSIQKRLMEEQIHLWCKSPLGQTFLKGKMPASIDEFRQIVPLTTYDDYADILLMKQESMLPGNPVIWIQTTWEGGRHPVKLAPYTRSMLDTFRDNVISCLILCTSTEKGQFSAENTDKILYGLAPLPYLTGLVPHVLREATDIQFLPPLDEAMNMSFSERNKAGFKLGMKKNIEIFFGLGSVAYAVSLSLGKMGSSGNLSSLLQCRPDMLFRILRAKAKCKQENREIKPKDLFKLKGFMVAGTDNNSYKDALEDLWGVRPMELFAGTEPSLMGTESWTRKGMYFFPGTCFYEFILEEDMYKNMEDPSYQPRTYLMDEVIAGMTYELAITVFKGGAFARYRVGDMYRCIGLENKEDGTKIPRFEYIDRVPSIIDIGGFTRISQNSIESVIELSGLPVEYWTAKKEFDEHKRPFMHLYIEISKSAYPNRALTIEILREHLGTYFKYIDQDYRDLKKILSIDPLQITILKCGTFEAFEKSKGHKIRCMNASYYDIADLLAFHGKTDERRVH